MGISLISGHGAEEGQNGLSWTRQGGKEANGLCYSSCPAGGVLVFPAEGRRLTGSATPVVPQ